MKLLFLLTIFVTTFLYFGKCDLDYGDVLDYQEYQDAFWIVCHFNPDLSPRKWKEPKKMKKMQNQIPKSVDVEFNKKKQKK